MDDVYKQLTKLQRQMDNLVKPEIPPLSAYALSQSGRLTLTSGTPITTGNVTAATTLYFTPYGGNRISLYDGGDWLTYPFSEVSLSLSGLAANTNYDVFVYNNAGTLTLEAVAWTNNTTRATALAIQDGVYVKSGATGRRYRGTFRTTSTIGQCEDSNTRRFLWNYYNQVEKTLTVANSTSHTYDGTTRAFNNDGSGISSVLMVVGLVEWAIQPVVSANISRVSGDSAATIGLGLNTSTSNNAQGVWNTVGQLNLAMVNGLFFPALGLNELWITETGGNTGTDPTFLAAALRAKVRC